MRGWPVLFGVIRHRPSRRHWLRPRYVTEHLHSLGLNAFGIGLSPAIVALARRSYPGLPFDQGSMTALDLPSGVLGGIVAMYSIIGIPAGTAAASVRRVPPCDGPRGHLMLAFQAGDDRLHVTQALGRPVSVDTYLLARKPADATPMIMRRAHDPRTSPLSRHNVSPARSGAAAPCRKLS